MTKYLIIANGESPHITKWARELAKYFELYLISSQGVSAGIREVIPEDRIFTYNLMISESGGNIRFVKMILPVIRLINKLKPDYVNAHYITSHGLVAALAKKFCRHAFILILTAWGSDILVTPYRNVFYRRITRLALGKADMVTSDSKHVDGIIQQFTPAPTMVFPFGPEKLPSVAFSEKDKQFFFSNRTLNANSNIDLVLHFFAGICELWPNARLVIANDGPLREVLQELSRQLDIDGKVEFVGFISQEKQQDLYRKAIGYFSLLHSDALSVSLLEAMAFGCIPLVSDLPDNRDWVRDGENGLIISTGTRADNLSMVLQEAEKIFDINRAMIAEKAIFPKSVEAYVHSILNMK